MKEEDMFLPSGYLDVKRIIKEHPKAVLISIVGARQVGKSYSAFNFFHEEQEPYFLLRRKEEHLQMVLSNKGTSYWSANFDWAKEIDVRPITKGVFSVYETPESNTPFCIASYLSKVSSIRGFANHDINWICFDEFIGQDIEPARRGEDTALLDIYDTINANRELEGREPVRMLLMANSNDIYSTILQTLNLTDIYIKMQLSGQQYCYIPQRRLVCINLDMSPISEQRRKNAIYQCIGTDSQYAKMALDNHFEWLDTSAVHNRNMNYYQPLFAIDDVTFWRLKNDTREQARSQGYTPCYVTDGVNSSVKTVLSSRQHNAKMAIWTCLHMVVPANPLDDVDISYATVKAKIAAYKICEIK